MIPLPIVDLVPSPPFRKRSIEPLIVVVRLAPIDDGAEHWLMIHHPNVWRDFQRDESRD
jgi:hypothetical protein